MAPPNDQKIRAGEGKSLFDLQQWAKLEEELSPPSYELEQSLLPPSYEEVEARPSKIADEKSSTTALDTGAQPPAGWAQRILSWLQPAEPAIISSRAALAAHLQSKDVGHLDEAITHFRRAELGSQQSHYKLTYQLTIAAYDHCRLCKPQTKPDFERLISIGNEALVLAGTADEGVRAETAYILGHALWFLSMPPFNDDTSLAPAWTFLTEAINAARLPSLKRHDARVWRSFLIIQDVGLHRTRNYSLEDIEELEWMLGECDISKRKIAQGAASSNKDRLGWIVGPKSETVLAACAHVLGLAHMHCATRDPRIQVSGFRGDEILFQHLDAAIGYLERAVLLNEGEPEVQSSIKGALAAVLAVTVAHRKQPRDLDRASALLSTPDSFPRRKKLVQVLAAQLAQA